MQIIFPFDANNIKQVQYKMDRLFNKVNKRDVCFMRQINKTGGCFIEITGSMLFIYAIDRSAPID